MPIRWSRALIVVEIIFLLLPVSFISVIFGSLLFRGALHDGNYALAFTAGLSLASLAAGWVAVSQFLIAERETFQRRVGIWLFLASLGALIALAAVVAIIYRPDSELSIFVFGCPAIVPFVHVAAERLYRGRQAARDELQS